MPVHKTVLVCIMYSFLRLDCVMIGEHIHAPIRTLLMIGHSCKGLFRGTGNFSLLTVFFRIIKSSVWLYAVQVL
jgi:hypothetical protein